MNHSVLALALVASFALACDGAETMNVHLSQGGGLAVGAPVQVNGVKVGEVSEVTVTPDGVDITARLDQELELRSDACGIAGGSEPTLYVATGEAAEPLPEGPVPECDVAEAIGAAMGEAAEQLGNLLRGFGAALGGNQGNQGGQGGQGGQATPSPTPAAPNPGATGSVNGAQTNEQIRNAGRALGEATRNFGEGFFEGAIEGGSGTPGSGAAGQAPAGAQQGGQAQGGQGAQGGGMPPPPGFNP